MPSGPGRKKEAFGRLLRSIGASGLAARRPCSGRLKKRHAVCHGPAPGFLPCRRRRESPASKRTSSREKTFFLLCLAGVELVYELPGLVTRNFSMEILEAEARRSPSITSRATVSDIW